MRLLVVMILAVVLNLLYALPPREEFQVILHNPFLSYENRLRLKFGPTLYDYISFIRYRTPPDSTIAIPPEIAEWGLYGNYFYMKNLLYPRKITNTPSRADFTLLVQGKNTIWPADSTEAAYFSKNPKLGLLKQKL